MSNYSAYNLVYKYPWLEGAREIFDPSIDDEEDPIEHYNQLFTTYFDSYSSLYKKIIEIAIGIGIGFE